MRARRAGRFSALEAVLVGVQVVVAAWAWHRATTGGAVYAQLSDAGRYRAVALLRGRPYRDFEVAYPPLAYWLFRALGPATFAAFVRRLLLLNFASQAAIVWMMFRRFGQRAGWSYLALSALVLPIAYTRFDLVPTALAVAAWVVLERRPNAAAALFVAAFFFKLWPIVLLGALFARGRIRAFVAGVALAAAAGIAWIAWGGRGAIRQVFTYRGAHGWEFESIPGSLLRLATRDALSFEQGAWRIGSPPAALGTLLTVALAAAVVVVWWRTAASGGPLAVAAAAAVATVMALGTLLSPQFLVWLVPWIALAGAAGAAHVERIGAAAAALTFLVWRTSDVQPPDRVLTEALVLARNAALVALVVVAVRSLVRPRARSPEPAAP